MISFWTVKSSIPSLVLNNTSPSKPLQKDYSLIGTGPLALQHLPQSLLISCLEQKMILWGHSSRPDLKTGEKVFSIGIKGKEQKQIIKEGEKVFLNISKHPSGGIETISFSPQATNLWFTAYPYKENLMLIRVTQDLQEEGELVLHPNRSRTEVVPEKIALINFFKEAKVWGKDKFFQQYGGDEYRHLGEKFKLELSHEKSREFFYVGSDDYFTFSKGTWKTIENAHDLPKRTPLAHIHFTSPGMFEIDVWDENGFAIFHGQLKEEIVPMQHFSQEQLLLNPKLRTAKQITCLIGKKRVLLKEGDWLMKTKSGWRTLKTGGDIQSYLDHTLIGELFVFDGLEIKNGQYFLKGHWFNDLHTTMQMVTFPINGEKKTKSKKKVLNSQL